MLPAALIVSCCRCFMFSWFSTKIIAQHLVFSSGEKNDCRKTDGVFESSDPPVTPETVTNIPLLAALPCAQTLSSRLLHVM